MKLLFFCPLILKNVTKKEKPANIYDEDTKKHLLKNFKTDSKPKDIRSPSTILLVAPHRPASHKETDGREGKDLMPNTLEVATTDKDGTDGLNEVADGIDVGGEI